MFKKAKEAFEKYNGYKFSNEYIQKIIDDDFGGDASALLKDIEREETYYFDDSWGDYETVDFC